MLSFIIQALIWSLYITPSAALYKKQTLTSFTAKRGSNNTSLPPKQDPWYTAPENFEHARPGAILRLRRAPGTTASAVNASAAYNILYRTTDSNYEPSWAVTTLYVPASGGNALLSYQWAYDSANLDESPSYTFQTAPSPDVATALSYGWFVNVPDYEGPLASFFLGVQAGHATLDSIRAVRSGNFGLEDAPIALWGYSGGSVASEWAVELQVQYAPDLKNISGVAAGGLVPNGTNSIPDVSGTVEAGLFFEGLVGLTSQNSAARQYVLEALKSTGPHNVTGAFAVENITFSEALALYAYQNVSDYFTNGSAAFYTPELQYIYNTQAVMGYHGVPQVPLFIYKAIADEVSVIGDTDELVDRYCQVGANILYQRNTVGAHGDEYINGEPRALQFLNNVLIGNYTHTGCTIQNVTVNITDTGL